MTTNSSFTQARLARLRDEMQKNGIDAWIVPSSDPHMSEYLPAYWQGRQWLSGFTGSAGTLVVTADWAGLWTDSRYWSQAGAELADSNVELMKMIPGDAMPYVTWLTAHLQARQVVGVDGAVLSVANARQMAQALQIGEIQLRTDLDLLDVIWDARAPLPSDFVYEHLPPHATVSRHEKLHDLREAMREQGANWHVMSTLDDIAYLLNLRGSDVQFNPVFVAHALIGLDQATLFVAEGKVTPELQAVLKADGIAVAPYGGIAFALSALPHDAVLLLDPHRFAHGLWKTVPKEVRIVEAIKPTILAKARKSKADIAHIREVMEQDGAALCEFFAWFEQALAEQQAMTELTIDEHITAARARRPGFVSPSFNTIAGFNANAAMPHYTATLDGHAVIEGDGLLLIDSGGQYLGGTTDITRVAPVGQPSQEQKRDFTLVLKGMIALSSVQFPRGIRAPMLDAIARAPLWNSGIDYGHGTGHGVGFFLGVHEGPHSISFRASADTSMEMDIGMVSSIEPGIYRAGEWGIRIENLVVNQEAEKNEFGEFLRFETLTLCPIDTRCLDRSLLSEAEIIWLNDYHGTVRKRLLPQVSGVAKAWLIGRTVAI